jgi:hypothetical protein
MKTKSQIRQWLLFFMLVAVALFLHVQYPIESAVSPVPGEAGMGSTGVVPGVAPDAVPGAAQDAAHTTAFPKAVVPPRSRHFHPTFTAHAALSGLHELIGYSDSHVG